MPSFASNAQEKVVQCRQWADDSIPASDMLSMTSKIYDEKDVRGTLLKMHGGVTSAVVREAVSKLASTVRDALNAFALSGFSEQAELQAISSATEGDAVKIQQLASINGTSMLRLGAPAKFNMKCYKVSNM